MPRRNAIDRHPERESIFRDLALGRGIRPLSRKYGIDAGLLCRVRKRLPDGIRRETIAAALRPSETDLEKLRVEESCGLLVNLQQQRIRLLLSQDAALASEQHGIVSQLSAQIHSNLRLVAEYLGELVHRHSSTTVSLVLTPEYVSLRTAILAALAPHPQARAAVAAAIQRIERQATQAPPQAVLAPPIDVTREAADA